MCVCVCVWWVARAQDRQQLTADVIVDVRVLVFLGLVDRLGFWDVGFYVVSTQFSTYVGI